MKIAALVLADGQVAPTPTACAAVHPDARVYPPLRRCSVRPPSYED